MLLHHTTGHDRVPATKAKAKEAAQAPTPEATAAKVAGTKVPPHKAGAAPSGLQKPLQPSQELAAVVGAKPLPRGEVVSKVWEYIKKNNLQNPQNKREIMADNTLQKVFGKAHSQGYEKTVEEIGSHLHVLRSLSGASVIFASPRSRV